MEGSPARPEYASPPSSGCGGAQKQSSRVSWEFIGHSSLVATVEGARRWAISAPTTKMHSTAGFVLRAVKRVASGPRKIEAVVEASLGNLDHKCTCTLVHLALGGRVCLGYRVEGGRLHANQGQGGQRPLTFEVNTALRFHSTHPATFPAIGGRMFFKPLTYLGPGSESP